MIRLSSVKTLDTETQVSTLAANIPCVSSHITERSARCLQRLWDRATDACAWSSWTLPRVPLSLADSNMGPSAIIHYNHKFKSFE